MTEPRYSHENDLGEALPPVPAEHREAMRDFLDRYYEAAYQIFERLERERKAGIDQSGESS